MKIKVTEYTTEIEADARELRESNTLASNFAAMLSRCFQLREPIEDESDDEIVKAHEEIGYDKGRRDGYAEAKDEVEE